jgi:hypothetical protein
LQASLLSTAMPGPKRVRRRIWTKMHPKRKRRPQCIESCTVAIEARTPSQRSKESGFPRVAHCHRLRSRLGHDGRKVVLAHSTPTLELLLNSPFICPLRHGHAHREKIEQILIWMKVQLNTLLGFFWIAAPLPFLNRVYCCFREHRMAAEFEKCAKGLSAPS